MGSDITSIWNELNKGLLAFINKKVRNTDLAKDISQDVFVKVFSNLDNLKNKDKIIPWIYQITRNEINSHFRKSKSSPPISSIQSLEDTSYNKTEKFSKCMAPMINALPEKYKEAINMSEIQGISQKEMALKIGISYSGAKSRVQRGREMLKSLLQECCEISTDNYGNIIDYQANHCNGNCK